MCNAIDTNKNIVVTSTNVTSTATDLEGPWMKHFYVSQHVTNIDVVPVINTCINNLELLRADPSLALTLTTDEFGTRLGDDSVLTGVWPPIVVRT